MNDICIACNEKIHSAFYCKKHHSIYVYIKRMGDNLEGVLKWRKLNYIRNRDKRALQGKIRYQRDKEKIKANNGRIETRYKVARSEGKRRNHTFNITFEEYKLIITPNICFYCYKNLNPTGSGLDRIDNMLGYIKTNVVPCCKICNEVKGCHLNFQEMIEAMKVINNLRNNKAVSGS